MDQRLPPGKFLGRVERQCDQADLVFSESLYRPNETLAAHRHARAFFFFVLEGSCLDVCDGRAISASNQSLVFHPAEENHANEWASCGGRCFHIELPPRLLNRFLDSGTVFQRCSLFDRCPAIRLAIELYGEFQRRESFAPLIMEGLAIELLAAVARYSFLIERGTPRWLLRLREMLHEEFDRHICLSQFADEVGVHPAHLSRAFRRQFGQTPGAYLRRVRVQAASRLLGNSSLSIAEVAIRVGFSDQSHLTKIFSRDVKVTPAAYRRALTAHK